MGRGGGQRLEGGARPLPTTNARVAVGLACLGTHGPCHISMQRFASAGSHHCMHSRVHTCMHAVCALCQGRCCWFHMVAWAWVTPGATPLHNSTPPPLGFAYLTVLLTLFSLGGMRAKSSMLPCIRAYGGPWKPPDPHACVSHQRQRHGRGSRIGALVSEHCAQQPAHSQIVTQCMRKSLASCTTRRRAQVHACARVCVTCAPRRQLGSRPVLTSGTGSCLSQRHFLHEAFWASSHILHAHAGPTSLGRCRRRHCHWHDSALRPVATAACAHPPTHPSQA